MNHQSTDEDAAFAFASPMFTSSSGESLFLSRSSVGGSSTTSLNTTATDDFMSTVENVEDLVAFDEDTISARAQRFSIPEIEEEENDRKMSPITVESKAPPSLTIETEMPSATIEATEPAATPTPVIAPNEAGSETELDEEENNMEMSSPAIEPKASPLIIEAKMPPTSIEATKSEPPTPVIALSDVPSETHLNREESNKKMSPTMIEAKAPPMTIEAKMPSTIVEATKTPVISPSDPDSERELGETKNDFWERSLAETEAPSPLMPPPTEEVTSTTTSAESNPDAAANVYKGAKGVWAWGKSVPVFSPLMGIAECVAGKALQVAGTNLQDLDSNLIEPQLQNLDSGILNPAIKTVAGIMLGAAGKAEGVVKPIIVIVLSPFKMLTQQPSNEEVEVAN
ncbi:unnamed protein product [Cylindrotheca closterium]|uniref:Uncharacterized protein n=1 Tax=Cylindrotheca closterium TaxID=2856 RepID=A0AAD2FIU3_9STRA|nr:unnamed protein product [Cylindrotheca closterium]